MSQCQKGVHIPRHIFAVCFQKIKTSFSNQKKCVVSFIYKDIDKIVKIRGLLTEREPLKLRKSTTKCRPPIAAKRTVVNPILPIFSQNIWKLWLVNGIVVNEEACFIFQ